MPRKTKTNEEPSPIVAAMRNLRASGDNSFEELTARLLSKLSGEPIRRCKAGDQGGIDARGSTPFAIEDKRHEAEIKSGELLGGLAKAVGRHPDLELWVLIATCSVSEQVRRDLDHQAEDRGIAVLILDTTTAEPDLPGISSIVALAATDIATTVAILNDPTWRVAGHPPDIAKIRRDLRAIRKRSGFSVWESRLRRELLELPTMRRLARAQNQRLLTLILKDAATAFDTTYDHALSIPRTAESELTSWWASGNRSGDCPLALVTGERYDGKTWVVFRWLVENLHRITLPVFFLPSRRVQDERGQIDKLLIREAEEALGTFARHAQAIIRRHRSRKAGDGPWCLVVLDGANEYVHDPGAFGDAVRWAYPPEIVPFRHDDDHISTDPAPAQTRRCGVVITCRSVEVATVPALVATRPTQRIDLKPYDDHELDAALAKSSLTRQDLATLPADAQEMVRHPFYFDLSRGYWQELGHFGGATSTVLHYLEATRKLLPQASRERLSPSALQELLAKLAVRWRRERTLDLVSVRQEVAALTQHVDRAVNALVYDGVLTEVEGKPVPDPYKLALGMGLEIRDRIRKSEHQGEWPHVLHDLLQPHRDVDEKVRWLRSAVTSSALAGDDARHPDLLDFLLAQWLAARNFSRSDLSELRNLTPLLLRSVIRMVSSPDCVDERLLLTAEAMIHSEITHDPHSLAGTIRRWLRIVRTDRPWHLEDGEPLPDFAARAGDPSLSDLNLELVPPHVGTFAQKRQLLALSLAASYPSLVQPCDLLAFIAARHAATDWLFARDGEAVAIRRATASTERGWFEQEVEAWTSKPETARSTALAALLMYCKRRDLADLQSRLPASYRELLPTPITREQLFGDTKDLLKIARRAQHLALDPGVSPPPQPWRTAFSRSARARFKATVRPYTSRSVTKDGLDLSDTEAALAAWAPEEGARIRRAILADVPRQIHAGDDNWAWDLYGHASLLTSADRRRLLKAVRDARPTPKSETLLDRAYVCVLAGAARDERLKLLLEHPFTLEYTGLYGVVAAAADASLRRDTIVTVRRERDALRLRRARYLLTYLGGIDASTDDLSNLVRDISRVDLADVDRNAAHELLEYARVPTSTAAEALGPLVEIALSPAEEAWQYEAFRDVSRHRRRRGAEWVARARSAPRTARHHGATGKSDEAAVVRGIAQLADRIEQSLGSSSRFSPEQFPEGIAAVVGEAAFDRWVRRILDSAAPVRYVDPGLLVAIVPHALRSRHPAAVQLWTLAYPFQRGRFAMGTRYVDHGLDWSLRELHDPKVDDGLGHELLRRLISDCRSDSELVEVALSARLTSTTRLASVVRDGLNSHDEFDRARARYIGGWMPPQPALRKRLCARDPSLWVERIGENASRRSDQERFARKWLSRFLAEPRRIRRWAAGRLFLACADASTNFWAPELIRKATAVPGHHRAEAHLLLQTIRAKTTDSNMRDHFLGYGVRDLESVIPPWRRPIQWDDIALEEPDGDESSSAEDARW